MVLRQATIALVLALASPFSCDAFVRFSGTPAVTQQSSSLAPSPLPTASGEGSPSSSSRCSRGSPPALAMGSEFMDEEGKRKLRDMLNKQFGKGAGSVKADEWAEPVDLDDVARGTILLADPAPFLKGDAKTLAMFGLPDPIPPMLSADRQADLLPCVLLIQHGPRYVFLPRKRLLPSSQASCALHAIVEWQSSVCCCLLAAQCVTSMLVSKVVRVCRSRSALPHIAASQRLLEACSTEACGHVCTWCVPQRRGGPFDNRHITPQLLRLLLRAYLHMAPKSH